MSNGLLVLMIVAIAGPEAWAQGRSGQRGAGRGPLRAPVEETEAKQPQGPLTLYELLNRLRLTPSLRLGLPQSIKERGGVDFQTDAVLRGYLREKGASDEILALLPAPPPPPKPPTAGPLTVGCVPVDCQVIVNDKYHGATADGSRQVFGVLVGQAAVRVYADGFDSATETLTLAPDETREIRFRLKRNSEFEGLRAATRLRQVIFGLGGMEGMIRLASSPVSGMVERRSEGGETVQWNMRLTPGGDGARFAFQNPNGQCSVSLAASPASSECKGKAKKSAAAEDLKEVAGSVISLQLHAVLGRMFAGKLSLGNADGSALRSEAADGVYVLALAKDSLPAKLELHRAGSKTPLRVSYTEYRDVGPARYPTRLEVSSGEGSKPSLVVVSEIAAARDSKRSQR